MKSTELPRCRPFLWGGALAMTVLGFGCASTPVPEAELAVSRTAINEALSAGAAESAPLDLQHAREKLNRADAAVAAQHYDEARLLAQEAEVDARLAAARARSSRATLAAVEIQKSIRTIRESIGTEVAPNPPIPRGTP